MVDWNDLPNHSVNDRALLEFDVELVPFIVFYCQFQKYCYASSGTERNEVIFRSFQRIFLYFI